MHIVERTRLREFLQATGWILLALELILTIAITGITGSAATGFRDDLHCDVPDKLNYNLALVG